jgi:hypothetical protein
MHDIILGRGFHGTGGDDSGDCITREAEKCWAKDPLNFEVFSLDILSYVAKIS